MENYSNLNSLTAHGMFPGHSSIPTQLKQTSFISMAVAFFYPVFCFLLSALSTGGFGSGFEASCHYSLTSVTVEYRPVNTVPATHDAVHLMACEAVRNFAE